MANLTADNSDDAKTWRAFYIRPRHEKKAADRARADSSMRHDMYGVSGSRAGK